eukprot:SAG31_NODE_134_length_23213_cov_5.698624_20_plen_76_part_00
MSELDPRFTTGGYTAVMELLLQHGADAVAADMDGNTPLHLAVIELSVGVASVLVEAMTGIACTSHQIIPANLVHT